MEHSHTKLHIGRLLMLLLDQCSRGTGGGDWIRNLYVGCVRISHVPRESIAITAQCVNLWMLLLHHEERRGRRRYCC